MVYTYFYHEKKRDLIFCQRRNATKQTQDFFFGTNDCFNKNGTRDFFGVTGVPVAGPTVSFITDKALYLGEKRNEHTFVFLNGDNLEPVSVLLSSVFEQDSNDVTSSIFMLQFRLSTCTGTEDDDGGLC